MIAGFLLTGLVLAVALIVSVLAGEHMKRVSARYPLADPEQTSGSTDDFLA